MKVIAYTIFGVLALCLICFAIAPLFPHRHQPAEAQQCASHMRHLGFAQVLYAEDHNGLFCGDPLTLTPYSTKGKFKPHICPVVQRKAKANMHTHQQGTYVIVEDLRMNSAETSVLSYCPPENHNSKKAVVLFKDCHIEIMKKAAFVKLASEQNIKYDPNGQ